MPPSHIGPSLPGAAVGAAWTVTEVVYRTTQPGWLVPSVTVSEYTVVPLGVAEGLSAAVDERLDPLHV